MFLGSVVLIISNYDEITVDRKGEIVKMRIESLPRSCIGGKVRYNVTYSYDGELFDKATRGDFCEKHNVGELIEMKFLKGNKRILRPDESAASNLAAFGGLGILGLLITITKWRKMGSFRER